MLPLPFAPGLELHHPIMSMIGGHVGRLESERDVCGFGGINIAVLVRINLLINIVVCSFNSVNIHILCYI